MFYSFDKSVFSAETLKNLDCLGNNSKTERWMRDIESYERLFHLVAWSRSSMEYITVIWKLSVSGDSSDMALNYKDVYSQHSSRRPQ